MDESEGRRGTVVIFDLSLAGFYKWSRRRLELLGFTPVITPYRHDFQIMTFAKLVDGLVVTTDKDFLSFSRAVVLKHDKYEKMYTAMLKGDPRPAPQYGEILSARSEETAPTQERLGLSLSSTSSSS